MSQAAQSQAFDDSDLTLRLAEYAMGLSLDDLPAETVEAARHCLMDWLGVTLAGSKEPLAKIMRDEAVEEGGNPQATILGGGGQTSALQAALVNGATGHALDYDDVNLTMIGHPTAAVAPAILALAEKNALSGKELLTALIAGIEIECRVGAMMNESHYNAGWHATGTVGTFGAAAGAAHLLGMDAEACARALGIAGTQAAGLKAMFGTMCKPFHAGKAAANGLYAAQLASRGFESRTDVLECEQGFADTQTTEYDPAAALAEMGTVFHTRNVLFKYHAACYGTHAAIEAASNLKRAHNIDPANVAEVEIGVRDTLLKMCNIQEPVTGLEGKFSLRFTTAMALLGENTGLIANYNVAKVQDAEIVELRDRIKVVNNQDMGKAGAAMKISMKDGSVHQISIDVETPEPDLKRQWSRLSDKFRDMAGPVIGGAKADRVVDMVAGLEIIGNVREFTRLCEG
ncbi:MAG: MmgE/PrpD family protein [Alphaproteobacteria bacterium]|nr:MmgE/PrpD family protein [Alphaproteobacteria bacterium]